MEALASKQGLMSTSDATPRMSQLPLNIDTDPLMEGMDYELQDKILFNMYRDMYWHDPVCGSAVDMFSTLPFSEFSIGGAEDKHLDPYREAIEILNMRTIFPELSIDYKVTGGFCGSLLYNKQKKKFIDLMCHRMDNIEIHPLFAYGQDPIINLELDKEMKSTLQLDSPRVARLKESVGAEFFDKLLGEKLELDPIGTLYVPRKTFTHSGPSSYFKRVLPIWLIEKNLYRGTLIESGRRQRGIMHLQIGDGDQWEPAQEDFETIANMFNNADADPIGAVVATRLGVSVDELRQGGDFWKVTDLWNETTFVKMRALGISEAFLSGDASYANMEGSLTVFVESIRSYRDHLTRSIFYNKIFPLVSIMNGKTINAKGKIVQKGGLMDQDSEDILRTMNDGSKLFIPTVHWAKQLKPEADQQYMDMLRGLQEMGVPVPLRAMAAAGGFNLDSLLNNRAEDLALQKQINSYQDELNKLKGGAGGEGGDDGGGFGAFANSQGLPGLGRSRVLDGYSRRPTLADRDFGEESEIYTRSVTGKKQHVFRQAHANNVANEKIAKALSSLDSKNPATQHLFGSTSTSLTPNAPSRPARRKRTMKRRRTR
ncbi:Phage protein [Phage NCTB]|nr:Phage protein [Phage NCTB]